MVCRQPRSQLFPYTTLFRSFDGRGICNLGVMFNANLEDSQVAAHIVDLNVQQVNLHSIQLDRKSTRLNSSHVKISYAVFCLKKKKKLLTQTYDTIDIIHVLP